MRLPAQRRKPFGALASKTDQEIRADKDAQVVVLSENFAVLAAVAYPFDQNPIKKPLAQCNRTA